MAIGRVNTGGGGSGGTLTVTGVVGHTVTATKGGKTYTRTFNSSGVAVFKGLSTGTWTLTMTGDGKTATRTVDVNADYAVTITYFSATISITYPANSNCVVANSGGQTVASDTNTGASAKTWTATVNAKGTYTVTATATDGSGKSKSQSVSIASDGQSVSVELTYRYYLFEEGAGAQNGFTFNATNPGVFSISDSKIVFNTNDALSNAVWATPAIDLSDYSVVNFEFKCINRYGASGSGYDVTFGVGSDTPSNDSNPGSWTAKLADIYDESRKVYAIDVSAITSAQYVKFWAYATTGEIYNIWLED